MMVAQLRKIIKYMEIAVKEMLPDVADSKNTCEVSSSDDTHLSERW